MNDDAADTVGIGEVTCPCGGLRLTASGTLAGKASMRMKCPSCGQYADVLADDERR
jgi:hypothetical protein